MSTFLADGQQMAFRYFVATTNDTVFLGQRFGTCEMRNHGSSNLRGTPNIKGPSYALSTLPPKRFANSEIVNVFNQVTAENAAPLFASPRQDLFELIKTLALQAINPTLALATSRPSACKAIH